MKNLVEEQYKNWVYPLPVEDMRQAVSGNYREIGDPLLSWPIFWPRKRACPEKMDILIAGCGTNQAAYYAVRNPNWNILGIDLSDSSLAHQEKLKQKHGLNNLTLLKHDLTKVAELGKDYDFITSTGVLHHLPDPDLGLKALKSVLRKDGVINLMLYGKSLRLGVYIMQEFFKILCFQQTQKDVDLVRVLLASLPEDHIVRRYTKVANDLNYDAGIVDTFLHPQDTAYYASDVFDFAERAGLVFHAWLDNLLYSLEASVPNSHPIKNRLQNLSLKDKSQLADLLVMNQGTHRFCVVNPEYASENKIDFDGDQFLKNTVIPALEFKVLQPSNPSLKQNAKCSRGEARFEMDYRLADIFSKMKLDNNLETILSPLKSNPFEYEAAIQVARKGFEELWQRGHIHILLPEN